MAMNSAEVRWHYRFRNFSRAYTLLGEALEREVEDLNELEREGAIQRFEYTFQLAWLTLKDRLEYGGIVFTELQGHAVLSRDVMSPVDGAEVWINMLVDRNLIAYAITITVSDSAEKRPWPFILAVVVLLPDDGLQTLG